MAAEEDGLPHLVEDPSTIIFQMRRRQFRDRTARAIRLPAEEEIEQPSSGHTFETGTGVPEGAHTSIEVELAISRLKRMIADSEGKVDVTGSSTLDFVQSVD